MIVRKKSIKAIPSTEYSFRLSLEVRDVRSTLNNYAKNLMGIAPELVEGYVYTTTELADIFTKNTVIHHFSPAIQADLIKWCITTAECNGYAVKASPRVCKTRGMSYGDAYFIQREKLK